MVDAVHVHSRCFEETYGKLAISKTGQMLMGWDSEKREFIYEDRSLKGAEFEIYADGDIVTQDNQGDTWFKDGEKVATIITGEKADGLVVKKLK